MFRNNQSLFLFAFATIIFGISQGAWSDFDLVRPWKGAWGSNGITPYIKINGLTSSKSVNGSQFGSSIANIGDINNDGVDDLAVGAIGEGCISKDTNITSYLSGSVYILFMSSNGSVKSHTRIGGCTVTGPKLISNDRFGSSIVLWKDSILAVGAPGTYVGTVYLLYLNTKGNLLKYQMIRGGIGGGPSTGFGSSFGSALANMG
eukprot:gene8777-18151_t